MLYTLPEQAPCFKNRLRTPPKAMPTSGAIEESVDLAHEIFNRVFRKEYRGLQER